MVMELIFVAVLCNPRCRHRSKSVQPNRGVHVSWAHVLEPEHEALAVPFPTEPLHGQGVRPGWSKHLCFKKGAATMTICCLRHADCRAAGSTDEPDRAEAQDCSGAAAISCCMSQPCMASRKVAWRPRCWPGRLAEITGRRCSPARGAMPKQRAPCATMGLRPCLATSRTLAPAPFNGPQLACALVEILKRLVHAGSACLSAPCKSTPRLKVARAARDINASLPQRNPDTAL